MRTGKSDWVEFATVSAFVAAVGLTIGVALPCSPPRSAELTWLESTYGPQRHSQYVEEWVIRDFFQGKRGGRFLDVGAADYKQWSNTYYLETVLRWSGVAVEPQATFAGGYRRFRPRTRFRPFFASNVTASSVRFYLNSTRWVASSREDFTARWGEPMTVEVPTVTLNDLLQAEGIDALDFVSMDIELAEPQALEGFDVSRFAPSLVCIEAHPEVRQWILDYFAERGYVVIGKYLRMDDRNLYFAPRGMAVKPLPPEVLATWTDG